MSIPREYHTHSYESFGSNGGMEAVQSIIKMKIQSHQTGEHYIRMMIRLGDIENKIMMFELAKSAYNREGNSNVCIPLLRIQHALHKGDVQTVEQITERDLL